MTTPDTPTPPPRRAKAIVVTLALAGGVLAIGGVLYTRALADTNHDTLAQVPKGVTAVVAAAAPFQPRRRYVGTAEPWVQAKIGPQMVAAYVDTVLVRPGAKVKRGDVIATLDCRSSSATSRAVAAQARALDAQHTQAAKEAARVTSLLDGKYVSENEVDQKRADEAAKAAQLAALEAQAVNTTLQVDDCVLRAPFDGEIATREADPGAFVRPGSAIATVIDRHLVRVSADVPEDDFENVKPGNAMKLRLLATGRELVAPIARRAPAADASTRTVHVELDVDDPERAIPVFTTVDLTLDVGTPIPATAIPLPAASVHGQKVTVYVVDGGVAKATRTKLVGERAGTLYVEPSLRAGALVVTEGRGLLDDGDRVTAKQEAWQP